MEARLRYEQAQDKMNLITARYMVEKNILVAKREIAALEGDTKKLDDLDNKITDLDRECEEVLPYLQKEVTGAYKELQYATKEVEKKVSAGFRDSYKRTRAYGEDGVLKGESIELIKNGNRIVLNTAYNADIIANGALPSISAQTININGQTIRVISKEHSEGVETSYLDGSTKQMVAGAGAKQYITRDENGSLIADAPELQEVLERMGIHNIEDIEKACQEIEKKAADHNLEEVEEDNDIEHDQSLTKNYN